MMTHLPSEERRFLDNGRLDNLLPWEYTPSNGIHSVFCRIRLKLPILVTSVHTNLSISPRLQFGFNLFNFSR